MVLNTKDIKIWSLIVCLTLLLSATKGISKVYKVIDPNGTVRFTDQKEPGATVIKLKEAPAVHFETVTPDSKASAQGKPSVIVSIEAPVHKATIRNNTGNVAVSVVVSPKFIKGYQIKALLDGKVYGEVSKKSAFILNEVFRGEHQLKVILMDEEGKTISESSEVTFFLHRPRVNQIDVHNKSTLPLKTKKAPAVKPFVSPFVKPKPARP